MRAYALLLLAFISLAGFAAEPARPYFGARPGALENAKALV